MGFGIHEDVPYDPQHGDRRQDLFHRSHSGDVAQSMAGLRGIRLGAGLMCLISCIIGLSGSNSVSREVTVVIAAVLVPLPLTCDG